MKDKKILHSFVDGTSDLIQSIKKDGTVEYANPTWLNTLQYKEEELANVKLRDFIFPGYLRRT